uniref:Uncharacterized protein n=1 Tax=Parascaris equorum TaxID=6256 RepID=A0A914RWA5_PAREQ
MSAKIPCFLEKIAIGDEELERRAKLSIVFLRRHPLSCVGFARFGALTVAIHDMFEIADGVAANLHCPGTHRVHCLLLLENSFEVGLAFLRRAASEDDILDNLRVSQRRVTGK